MKTLFVFMMILCCCETDAQEQEVSFLRTASLRSESFKTASIVNCSFHDFNLLDLLASHQPAKKILGYSANGKAIDLYYFPGRSEMKALIVGGVHGSELSSVEVANTLIESLKKGEKPYYSVLIIPALFPDNIAAAENADEKRVAKNTGRYSHPTGIDPNRQMPALAKPFVTTNPVDAYGRTIEKENALLLQLIQAYGPQRIISIHAIKDVSKAGIYADPRADCEGNALGFDSDSALAVTMAGFIEEKGGSAPGNKLQTDPTALYYLDPRPAPVGEKQSRNLSGMNMLGRISGVSLGSWASTAVCDEGNNYFRNAIKMLTMEFPGYKKPSEYKSAAEIAWCKKQIAHYASAIQNHFLQDSFTEDNRPVLKSIVAK